MELRVKEPELKDLIESWRKVDKERRRLKNEYLLRGVQKAVLTAEINKRFWDMVKKGEI